MVVSVHLSLSLSKKIKLIHFLLGQAVRQSLDHETSVDLWSDTIAMDLSISTHPSLVISSFKLITSEGCVEKMDRSMAIVSDHRSTDIT